MGSAAGTCEIARLPEDLLSAALALTTPRDACRAAAVSRAFRDAAGSDAVWARFLPRDLPPIADGSSPAQRCRPRRTGSFASPTAVTPSYSPMARGYGRSPKILYSSMASRYVRPPARRK
jgi:hypothetical protein